MTVVPNTPSTTNDLAVAEWKLRDALLEVESREHMLKLHELAVSVYEQLAGSARKVVVDIRDGIRESGLVAINGWTALIEAADRQLAENEAKAAAAKEVWVQACLDLHNARVHVDQARHDVALYQRIAGVR